MSDIAEYCSVKTIAKRLDCGESTVVDYTDRGLLPRPRKIGGLVRWKWSEVEAMLDNQSKPTGGREGDTADPILRAINGG